MKRSPRKRLTLSGTILSTNFYAIDVKIPRFDRNEKGRFSRLTTRFAWQDISKYLTHMLTRVEKISLDV